MAKTLDVYLQHDLAGRLIQDNHGEMIFTYAENWLNNSNSIPLSHSLPLRKERFSRKECRGFFAGLLPEESKRELIAKNLGISAKNDFSMLEQIGGECAGAVTFIPAGVPLPEHDCRYRKLSNKELAAILRELPRRPLLAGDQDVRLSLAGAQDKVAVHVAEGHISIPLGGAPSTHILKPANEHFDGVVFNEAFCMKLASAIGLPVANVETGKIENIDYLLVQRYDRAVVRTIPPGSVHLERLHQEDFCQALGIVSEKKYQAEGGPSIKQCFDLLREVSTTPVIDLQRLLDGIIFNYLIGNNDAHGKNFSLVYNEGEEWEIRLAPFYDLLSTAYYPNLSPKMAMKIGGEYVSSKIAPKNFEQLAENAGLAKPIVRKRVPELARNILDNLDNVKIAHKVAKTVADQIHKRCQETIDE